VDRPVDCNDIFPTILEFAGVDVTPFYEGANGQSGIDGRSLASVVENPKEGGKSYERDTYFWHYPYNVQVYNPVDDLPLTPHSAIRKGITN
jgi:arylsulfatase A-like enzyme